MFFIFGWLRRFSVLGVKADECATCGQVSQHVVGRKTHWGHLFWIPVLFLGFTHGMVCSSCGAWTGIPWRQVKGAMKTGEALSQVPGTEVLTIERCSGHAGTWGVKKEFHDIALKIGRPVVRGWPMAWTRAARWPPSRRMPSRRVCRRRSLRRSSIRSS